MLKRVLTAILVLIDFFIAYSQESQIEKEIEGAITNSQNGLYEQAIPILQKYAEMKGFDDFNTLRINVYKNLCYLGTKNKTFDLGEVNTLTDLYLAKHAISITDSIRSSQEIQLLHTAAIINTNVGDKSKVVFYLLFIKRHFEKNHFIREKSYPEILGLLSQGYYNLSDYKSAIETGLEAWDENLKLFGENSENSLNILEILSYSYQSNNELKKYLECLQKRVEIGKKILGEKNIDYLSSLNDLSLGYEDLGDYKKALEISLKVAELSKNVLGEKHPDYLTCLNNLSSVYSQLGSFQKALEIDLEISELRKEILGEKHSDYLTSLINLAADFSQLGDYHKALKINLKVVELFKEVLGENNPDYFSGLGNLATIYLDLGDYQKSLEISLKVVELRKQVLGEKHPEYLLSLSNLAHLYSKLGNFTKAQGINLQVIELRKEVLGDKHPEYLKSLANLAMVYSNSGEYLKSLEILLKVIESEKVILGERHPGYLRSLSNLATIYFDLGDYQKALELDQIVVELREEVLGNNHPDYLLSLNNLATEYLNLGNFPKALENNLKVIELAKELLGEKNPAYLTSLSNLSSVYSGLGEYSKALEIRLKVVELEKEILGEKHPKYLLDLNNLACDYSNIGDYQKAMENNLLVVELGKDVWGEKHPNYLVCLLNLAVTNFHLSEYNSSLNQYLQFLNKSQEIVIDYFSMMTGTQREQFWKQYSRDFNFCPMFSEKVSHFHSEVAGYVYNSSLFSKGLILNTTIEFDKLINEKGTPEAITKFEELKILKLEIQRLTEKPISGRYLNVDSLENIAQQKETELVKLSKEYGDYTQNLKINWEDVQANLQDKDVAIEFVEYPTLTDTVKYAALVLRKGWQYPRMIPLFRNDQIDAFIKQDKDNIYSNSYVGRQIKKMIWDPLEEVISPGECVYFSPAGIIHQIAIENLPVGDSITLGDVYRMFRLSSTKELALQITEPQNHIAVLYGGLQYDLPEEKMMAESKKYEKQESLYAMRGYSNDTTVRKGWEYLGGTLQEVDQIDRLMTMKNYRVNKLTGETGNEESFKSLSGNGTGIIHIATHGFFLPIVESRKNLFVQMRMGDQRESKGGVDPMLRSGLMLSGGNRAWQGEKVPETVEDGVLTAREISRMDLRGTYLVVLSACETGLGEVSSEGVFGLQRSFKQAGVKTLLMSLWQVNDEATRFMMTEFYSGLMSGKDKRTAFLDAKRKCKEQFPEPRYWAAFIMLD